MTKCVYCRQNDVNLDVRPFCSRLCQDRDLIHWMDNAYAIAGEPASPEDELGVTDALGSLESKT